MCVCVCMSRFVCVCVHALFWRGDNAINTVDDPYRKVCVCVRVRVCAQAHTNTKA